MKKKTSKKQTKDKKDRQNNTDKLVKMRSIDEANMKMSLKDEADGNGEPY